ncbi:MAG TPA: hypothetical protein VN969_29850 [Streptosporangiaceae bacterium]|nr:hypothetical protein [Streptosporangiaceae bacterium]
MNEHDDVMCQVRESFSGLHMDTPVEKVFARSSVRRRRRRLSGLTAAAAAAAGVAAAMTLTLGGPPPTLGGPASARPVSPPPPSPGSVRLAAFSVTSGPGHSTTLILYKGPKYRQLDPSALRQALAQHGIPALVSVGAFCRSTPAPASFGQVVHPLNLAGGSAMVINGQAMPSGTRLSIGYFSGHVRMALIEDGVPLSCSSTFHQPAVHITPSGTTIRGGQ